MTEEKKIDGAVAPEGEPQALEQAVEGAESLMQFPMDFPIKVMGLADPSFPQVVEDIARMHCEVFYADRTSVEYSRTRKYMSVTVELRADSREQLDELYRALTGHPMVKIVL